MEKWTTEDEIVEWHHRLNGHASEQAPGDGEGQGSLVCCSPCGRKESETTATEQQQLCIEVSRVTLYSLDVLFFPVLNQFVVSCLVLAVASCPAYRFLRRIDKVVWCSHLFKSLPQFVVICTEALAQSMKQSRCVFFFFELPCFFYDFVDVGSLISGSFPFSKSSLYIRKFLVHILLKPNLNYFEHNLASM